MIERAFEYLFVLALVAPPAVVAIGALVLAVRPLRRHPARHAPHPVGV